MDLIRRYHSIVGLIQRYQLIGDAIDLMRTRYRRCHRRLETLDRIVDRRPYWRHQRWHYWRRYLRYLTVWCYCSTVRWRLFRDNVSRYSALACSALTCSSEYRTMEIVYNTVLVVVLTIPYDGIVHDTVLAASVQWYRYKMKLDAGTRAIPCCCCCCCRRWYKTVRVALG